ncbi:tRNA (N6-isopentenyl adenosine(37)-C2)-methylthiotransferase MiaB, partial [bacterium]|nr:tRNA (N6-isopentenyl adenosine(37)-C2)-methylthiotransferase MiaB [bacterium]
MKYYIITYGCQMNKSDSKRIAAILEQYELKQASEPEEADLIVVNMCSVRQSAVDRVLSKIKNLKLKIKNSKILVTGCVLKKDKEKFKQCADAIVDVQNLQNLPRVLKDLGFKIKDAQIRDYLNIEPKYEKSPIAYVPVMTGCNNFCAYCVVPYTRGPERSRPPEDILCEIENWIKRGVKEIWLLGQNVNSYKSQISMTNDQKEIDFSELLKMVNDVPGEFWIRFTSSHPKDLTDEMIETMAKCEKVTPYINLPVQSGDDEILKRMNRPYTATHYEKLIKKLRSAFKKYRKGLESELAISTDIIVGFPGETRKHFENTKKLVKEVGFSMAYIAQYSPRPGTAAYNLKDDVLPQEKAKREKELTEIIKKTALKFNK